MPATKKKIAVSPIRAIKLAILLALALFLGFFFVERVEAQIIFEDFEYNEGSINGQGEWYLPYGYENNPCYIDNIKSFSGSKAISVKPNGSVFGCMKDIATSTKAFFSFKFYAETKETGNNILYFISSYPITMTNDGIWTANGTILLPNSDTWTTKVWHTLGVDIDKDNNIIKARYDLNNWSATSTWDQGDITNVSFFYNNAYRNEQDFFIDYLEGYGSYGDYIYQELGLPELPALEECSSYGLTERLLCELKNFFYRLFVPSPEKVSELRNTLDLIKAKFPYNYILAIKDFFVYLKDNVNESEIEFSVLGNAGVISFDFFNSSTTLAGVSQSFLNIFKTFFKFLLILIFGLWCFSFIKRIFK